MGPVSNTAIADTLAAVLRGREYARHEQVSIGALIAEWIWSALLKLFALVTRQSGVALILKIVLAAVVLILIARVIFGIVVRYSPASRVLSTFNPAHGIDWWSTAQQRAESGDFTGAAHALYLALLGFAAHSGLVSLHESKTTGDYLREIRRRPDAIDLSRFTDFTRSYETVIYGIGVCDRERYSRLHTIAATLLGTRLDDAARTRTRHVTS